MANNLEHHSADALWREIGQEQCDCDIEIFVIRRDKVAVLMSRELPLPPEYVRVLLASLLDLPKIAIKKITVSVDGGLMS
jgi:hypothetical protein